MFLINWFFTKNVNTDLKEKENEKVSITTVVEENKYIKSEMVCLNVSEPEHNLEIEIEKEKEKEEPIIKNVIEIESIINDKDNKYDTDSKDEFSIEYEGEETCGEIEEDTEDEDDKNNNKFSIHYVNELKYGHDEMGEYELKNNKLYSTSFIPLKIKPISLKLILPDEYSVSSSEKSEYNEDSEEDDIYDLPPLKYNNIPYDSEDEENNSESDVKFKLKKA